MDLTRLKKRLVKLIKVLLINLLVLVVLLEAVSIGFYFTKTGSFFYTRNTDGTNSTAREFETYFQQASNEMSVIYRFHPYFGFVYRKGYVQDTYVGAPYSSPIPTNNFGFLSHQDFPFKKTSKDQFVIGIFGGSVAALFSFYEQENRALGRALEQLPLARNKEIVVLNLAAGGYKQPQQLLVLNYFLSIGQQFDMVINIDGVNDTEYWNNRFSVDVSMPMVHVSLPLTDLVNKNMSTEELTLSLEILEIKNNLIEKLDQIDESRFATSYALAWAQVKYLTQRYQKKLETFARLEPGEDGKDSLIYLNRVGTPLPDSDAYEKMADIWADASMSMNAVLAAKNIPYFHFIQPNQYYPSGRPFSEAEKKIAFEEGNAVQESVTNAYPRLLARMSRLRASGVRVFNALHAFDQTSDIVYVDNTCHYNKLGNEVLGNFISQSITEALR